MGRSSEYGSPRLGDRLRVWPYWTCRFLIFAIPIAVVAMLVPPADRWPFVGAALVIVLFYSYARDVALSAVVSRTLLVLGVLIVSIAALKLATQWFAGPGWKWSVGIAVGLIALLVLRRRVGAVSPRFIGVPRPDASDEPINPLEGTSDDAVPLVDALDSLWGSTRAGGPRAGLRAVHSHGSGASGGFAVDSTGPRWWTLPLLEQGPLSAIARFSNFSGTLHRDDSLRAPHGLAVRLTPTPDAPEEDGPDAGTAGIDLVLVDIRRFPVSNRDDFFGFIRRYGHWMRFALFWLVHRTSLVALKALVPLSPPGSYATRTYHSLNTFMWKGEPVRFRLVPLSGRAPPPIGDRRTHLDRDLLNRLRHGCAQFELHLVRGRGLPDAVLQDARRAWPRWWMPDVRIGTLTLDTYLEREAVEAVAFDPHRLPEGVEPSRDEVLMARRAAYPESHLRRCPI